MAKGKQPVFTAQQCTALRRDYFKMIETATNIYLYDKAYINKMAKKWGVPKKMIVRVLNGERV